MKLESLEPLQPACDPIYPIGGIERSGQKPPGVMWGLLKGYSAFLVHPDVSEVAPETPGWGREAGGPYF